MMLYKVPMVLLTLLFVLPGFSPQSMRRDSMKKQSLQQCHCLSTDSSANLAKLVRLSLLLPLFLSSHHLSCILLLPLAGNSAALPSTSCTMHQFPSPDFSFTPGLKFHPRAGISTQAQPRDVQRSQHCMRAQLLCQYQGRLMPQPTSALNYSNTFGT